MASKLFDDLLLQGLRAGKMPAREAESRTWFRDKARAMTGVSETRLMREAEKNRLTMPVHFQIGSMYMFMYDPKHKKTLPYYDQFPVIFPINAAKGGFYGINWHYLPYPLRAKLMDALYDITSDTRYDENTKIKLSYQILNGATKFKPFKPTLKHYLFPHVKSKLIYVHPTEWDMAIFLPVERFIGASKTTVWKDSRAMIRG